MFKQPITLSPILLLLFFTTINLIMYTDRGLLSSLLSILSNPADDPQIPGLSLSNQQQGALGSLFMFGYIFSAPIFAHFSQTYHPFYLIAFGLTIWALSVILTATSFTYTQLIISRGLSGVGEASFVSLAPPLIIDSASEKHKSTWIAIFYSTIAFGYAVGYLFGGFVVNLTESWRIAFSIEGILIVPFVGMCLVVKKEEGMIGNKEVMGIGKQIGKLFGNLMFVFISFGFAAYVFSVGAFGYWIPTIFKELYGTSEDVGNILSGGITVVCGVFGTILGSVILDWIVKECVCVQGIGEHERKRYLKHKYKQYAIVFSAVTTLVACIVGVFGSAYGTFIVFTIGFGVAEFFLFLSSGPVMIALMDSVPDRLRGQANAIAIFLMHLLGDFPSPYIIGWIFQTVGYYEGTLFISCWLIWAVILWGIASNISRFEKPSLRVAVQYFLSPAPKKDEKNLHLLTNS